MVKNITTQISSIILYLFHPIIIIFYLLVILLFCSSIGDNEAIVMQFKLSVIAHVSLVTVLLPFLLILGSRVGFKRLKLPFLKNHALFELLIVAICYLIAMFATISYLGTMISQKLFLTSAITITAANVLMIFFPVSLHLVAVAALTALLAGAQVLGYGALDNYVAFFVIIAGLLATCQLYLQKFSPLQTLYSYLLGLVLMTILLLL